jgi:hypothetical protein
MNRFYEYRETEGSRVAFAVDNIAWVIISDENVRVWFKHAPDPSDPLVLDGLAADNFQLWWDSRADVYRD